MNSDNKQTTNQHIIFDDDVEILIDDLIDDSINIPAIHEDPDSIANTTQSTEQPNDVLNDVLKDMMGDQDNQDFLLKLINTTMGKVGVNMPTEFNFNNPEFKNDFFENILNVFAGSDIEQLADNFNSLDHSQQNLKNMISTLFTDDSIKNNLQDFGKVYGLNSNIDNLAGTLSQTFHQTDFYNDNLGQVFAKFADEVKPNNPKSPDVD